MQNRATDFSFDKIRRDGRFMAHLRALWNMRAEQPRTLRIVCVTALPALAISAP